MEKIITLFQRNYETDRLVRNEVVPGAEWVLQGEGIATVKYDGTCAMFRQGKLYKRYDLKAKKGRHKAPEGWEPAQPEPDATTTSWPGWLPVDDSPNDQYFVEAWGRLSSSEIEDGTFELVGPKVQGNPEQFPHLDILPSVNEGDSLEWPLMPERGKDAVSLTCPKPRTPKCTSSGRPRQQQTCQATLGPSISKPAYWLVVSTH